MVDFIRGPDGRGLALSVGSPFVVGAFEIQVGEVRFSHAVADGGDEDGTGRNGWC